MRPDLNSGLILVAMAKWAHKQVQPACLMLAMLSQVPESASCSAATWNLPLNASTQFLLIHLTNVHLPHSQLNHSMQTRMTRKAEKWEGIHYLPRDPVKYFQIHKRQMVFFPQEFISSVQKQSMTGQDSGAEWMQKEELYLQSVRNAPLQFLLLFISIVSTEASQRQPVHNTMP